MHSSGDYTSPEIVTIAADDDEHARVRETWGNFNVSDSQCSKEEDRARILAVVESHPGGTESFNDFVRALAASFVERASKSTNEMWTPASSWSIQSVAASWFSSHSRSTPNSPRI